MEFKEISIDSFIVNPFLKIKKQWMIISAGDQNSNNLMTASWGMFGVLWKKYMFQVFIRPQRYTKEFVDNNDFAAISFLPDQFREALNICGTVSGKNCDKWKEARLHPYYIDGTVAVKEAELILLGKKQYSQRIDPKLIIEEQTKSTCYPEKDYHEVYYYEVVKILDPTTS